MSSKNLIDSYSLDVDTKPPESAAPAPGGLGSAAGILVPGAVLALLSTTVVGVAVPDISTSLGSDLASAQWITTAYLLASVAAIPVGVWASVRFGVRAAWLAATALFTLGAAGAAVAPDIAGVTAARVGQGLGGGAMEPLMLTAMARLAGPVRMGRVMGAIAAVMALGPLAGPALGGIVVDALGWRWTFGFIALAGVLVAIGSWLLLRDRTREAARLDAPGLVLLALSTTLVLLGLSRTGAPDGVDVATIGTLVAGFVALAAFVVWARRRGDGAIVNLSTFASRGFAPAVFIMAMMGAAIYPLFFGLPQFYQGVAGLGATTSGLLMIPYGLGTLFMMPVAGRLSDHVDGRVIVGAGAGATMAGFLALLATGRGTPVVIFALISFLIGLGLGSVGSPTVSTLYRVLPPRLMPSGSTILYVMNQLGGALGVALITVLIGGANGSTWGPEAGSAPFWLPVAAMVAVGVATVRLASRPSSYSERRS